MSVQVGAKYYADQAVCVETSIVSNERIAAGTYRVRMVAPEIAATITPGQFVMLRFAKVDDPLIGRALALYNVSESSPGQRDVLEVVYLAKGKFTSRLATHAAGTRLAVWGPLGNGFRGIDHEHVIMVAGGVGVTPFVALARELLGRQQYGDGSRPANHARRVSLVYGARSGDALACLPDFRAAGAELHLCTDDGSVGLKGRVPDLLQQLIENLPSGSSPRIVTCGPEIMMERVSEVALDRGLKCDVSLETPMACGIGICFSCVAKVRQADGSWDYKRTCVDGPVFDANEIVW